MYMELANQAASRQTAQSLQTAPLHNPPYQPQSSRIGKSDERNWNSPSLRQASRRGHCDCRHDFCPIPPTARHPLAMPNAAHLPPHMRKMDYPSDWQDHSHGCQMPTTRIQSSQHDSIHRRHPTRSHLPAGVVADNEGHE